MPIGCFSSKWSDSSDCRSTLIRYSSSSKTPKNLSTASSLDCLLRADALDRIFNFAKWGMRLITPIPISGGFSTGWWDLECFQADFWLSSSDHQAIMQSCVADWWVWLYPFFESPPRKVFSSSCRKILEAGINGKLEEVSQTSLQNLQWIIIVLALKV